MFVQTGLCLFQGKLWYNLMVHHYYYTIKLLDPVTWHHNVISVAVTIY